MDVNTFDSAGKGSDELRLFQAQVLYDEGSYEAAFRLARAYLNAHPDDPDALTILAQIYIACGEYEIAQGMVEVVLKSRPGDSDAWAYLAQATQNGDADQAVEAARRAVQLAPNSEFANLCLANALISRGEPPGQDSESVAVAQHFVELAPMSSQAHVTLGNAYYSQQNFTEAENAYGMALELEPGSTTALTNTGLIKLHNKRYRNAVDIFSLLVKANPGDSLLVERLSISVLFTIRSALHISLGILLIGQFCGLVLEVSGAPGFGIMSIIASVCALGFLARRLYCCMVDGGTALKSVVAKHMSIVGAISLAILIGLVGIAVGFVALPWDVVLRFYLFLLVVYFMCVRLIPKYEF